MKDYTEEIYNLLSQGSNIEDIANSLTASLNAAREKYIQEQEAKKEAEAARLGILRDLYKALTSTIMVYGLEDAFHADMSEDEFVQSVDALMISMKKLGDICKQEPNGDCSASAINDVLNALLSSLGYDSGDGRD